MLSREVLVRTRRQLLAAGQGLKAGLGVFLVLIGLAILTGFDKRIETGLVNASPQWLTDLTTRF
jgi:cytochrome c-type biogenesis protein